MLLQSMRNNRLDLRNTDFDTGQPTRRGEYKLADETYADLLARLTSKKVAVPDAMRADIMRFYGTVDVRGARDKRERRELEKIEKQLAML
jgi:hypothetical protein